MDFRANPVSFTFRIYKQNAIERKDFTAENKFEDHSSKAMAKTKTKKTEQTTDC